jgi:hypothetical protein
VGVQQTVKRDGKRSRRRGYPIHAYVGHNGSGKSAFLVHDTLPSLEAGRPVLSTVHILKYALDDPAEPHRHLGYNCNPSAHHPLFVALDRWVQLLEADRCDVLLDEVTGIASSRESTSMPGAIANLLVQLRRRDVSLRWSAPNWKRADTIIRECTQAVTLAKAVPMFSEKISEVDPVTGEVTDRLWRARRWFCGSTYDAAEFEEFTGHKQETVKVLFRQFLSRRGRPVAFRAYDTFSAVESLQTLSDSGACLDCGGHVARSKCECPASSTRKRATTKPLVAPMGDRTGEDVLEAPAASEGPTRRRSTRIAS